MKIKEKIKYLFSREFEDKIWASPTASMALAMFLGVTTYAIVWFLLALA